MATAIRPVDRSVRFIMASLRLLVEAEGGLAFRRRMSFVEPRAPVNLTLASSTNNRMHGLSRIREAACRRLCRSVSGVVPTSIATLWLSHDVLVSTE